MNDKTSTELNIHIDHLVVEGISLTYYQRQVLKETVESELRDLFSSKGIPDGIENVSQSQSSRPMAMDKLPSDPALLGKQVATALYDRLQGKG